MKQLTASIIGMAALSSAAMAADLAPVVAGGVSKESEAVIEQKQEDYSLKLVFTGEGGMYLADVAVRIEDQQGNEVVNGISEGPFLLAELKPGRYTVDAKTQGVEKKRTVTVGNNLNTYHMQFPIEEKEVSSLTQ